MQRPWYGKTFALACALAGLCVGVADGLRVAFGLGLAAVDVPAAVALVAGLDVVAGAVLGALLGAALAAGRWGRAAGARWSSIAAWIVAGAAEAWVVGSAFLMTGARKNRFLAGLVIAALAVVAAAALAVVAPALGRALGRLHLRSQRSGPRAAGVWTTPAGSLVFAPLAAVALSVVLVACAMRAHVPVRRSSINLQIAAAVAAALPCLLAWLAARAPQRLTWKQAAGLALAALGVPVVVLVKARWISDFRFVPWRDLAVVSALVLGTAALVALPRVRVPSTRWTWLLTVGLCGLGAGAALSASGSEAARKAAARAGVAGVAIDRARGLLDRDRDGYARWLGGGDCDDGDPARNPMARDWPDDGLDQDCDGRDARFEGAGAPPFHAVPASVPKDLNVLLITIDTLRADRLGVYGYGRPTSPALDRLAAEGVLFERGWAHAPSTRYSMPAIALGRWPSTIDWNMSIWWPGLGTGQRTIGEVFKSMGYQTGAFFAYEYFDRGAGRGFERGIDDYRTHLAARHGNVGGDPAHSVGTSGAEMADDVIGFITQHQRSGNKWFLWAHFYDPHLEYQKHPGIDFGDSQSDLYDAEIKFTDDQIGRVLAAMKKSGAYDDTVVFITGDHGEMLGEHADEHGSFGHGYRLYSQVTKVPFIARVPGMSPRRIPTPVGHVDIAPTLVNLARGPREPTFLGRSMVDVMAGTPAAPPPAPVLQDFGYEGPTEWRGLVSQTHHLIWNVVPRNTRECYAYDVDPQERNDLWGTADAGPCEALRGTLEAMVKRQKLGKLAEAVTSPGVAAAKPTHEKVATLGDAVKYLGYDMEPAAPVRGGRATLTHHFESLRPVQGGWRPFFHLAGPGGLHQTLDHVPVAGEYPIERWRTGQRVRDRHVVELPAALPGGRYTVYVGLWRGGERMAVTPAPASDGQSRLAVVSFDLP